VIALAVHYAQPPEWRWYILGYFLLAGLSGGAYAIGAMLRLAGGPTNEPAARVCFLLALPLLVLCPVLLTADLGSPLRFWHMLVDAGPGGGPFVLKPWSPMSLGAWALLVFGVFAAVSFLDALARDGRAYPLAGAVRRVMGGPAGLVVTAAGGVLALFVAGYTGVLLSVSNQPVWSDTYALGGLFLASGLSGAAALVVALLRRRAGAGPAETAMAEADRWFALLELALIAVLLVTLAFAGQLARAVGAPWSVLWVVAVLGLLPALAGPLGRRLRAGAGGAAALARMEVPAAVAAVAVLVGVAALRAAVLWSAQA
jgi:formate-dependent nitrite reductase membrane component NrfD